jgi:hypothetical protein
MKTPTNTFRLAFASAEPVVGAFYSSHLYKWATYKPYYRVVHVDQECKTFISIDCVPDKQGVYSVTYIEHRQYSLKSFKHDYASVANLPLTAYKTLLIATADWQKSFNPTASC